jgi:hypothetical protein
MRKAMRMRRMYDLWVAHQGVNLVIATAFRVNTINEFLELLFSNGNILIARLCMLYSRRCSTFVGALLIGESGLPIFGRSTMFHEL